MNLILHATPPRIIALIAALFLAGCATAPKTPPPRVYFPAPPDEPRLQFLTSFSSERGFSSGGKFLNYVVGADKTDAGLAKPYGIAVRDGKLYVCDSVPAVVEILDLSKGKLRYFGSSGEGRMRLPINVALDADGTRYVTDTTRGQVLIYSARDEYIGAIGAKDELKPTGIAVAGERIYVTDLKNHSVRVYDKAKRELLFSIPRDPKDDKARLMSPTNIAIDRQGRIIVSDTGGFFIQIYDAQGNHLRMIGEQGLNPGSFALPKGIAVDREGRIYVVDAATQVIQLFDAEGRILMYFGNPQTSGPGSTDLPAGIAVDYDHLKYFRQYAAPDFKIEYLVFVTNQYGDQKISVYGFGHKTK
jgi:DNA-binding beta-propeller fold protein YncE